MVKIIFAITLSIMIFAGCSTHITPAKDGINPDTPPAVETDAKLMSEDEIKKIALEVVPEASEADITEFKKDSDNGRWEYEITIVYDKFEYEFEIDAETGKIISQDKESIYD